jgi:hypothetical protein
MGNRSSVQKINFEDMQYAITDNDTIIINTMKPELQDCLIYRTVLIHNEVELLNQLLNTNTGTRIVIYGINASDETIVTKYNQLASLGFYNVYVYPGGLFEWLLLQDIYGTDAFRTTKKELDILKYKSHQMFNLSLLEY